jgi:2-polyprenyl-3-methyl-5-hydroxy-6-metoxy-1,4-benzoquinol methylase
VGELLAFCKPATYVGYDRNIGALAVARQKYPHFVFCSDFAEVQKLGKRFDVIVMAAVIEHLEDPLETLCTIRELIAKDGRIVLTTPHPHWRWLHESAGSLGFLLGMPRKTIKPF